MNGRAQIDLSTFAVIFVLARELLALELVQHLADGLSRLRQHRLQGHAWRELALFAKLIDADIEQRGNDEVVTGKLAGQQVSCMNCPTTPEVS